MKEGKHLRWKKAMHLIIDGYNLIRQSDPFREAERISLEEGRKALLRALARYRKARRCRITVVFDGWQSGADREERDREEGVTAVYSRKGERADEVIVRMAEKKGEEIVVVTSDRAVAHAVESLGQTAVSSPDFALRLSMASFPEEGGDEGDDTGDEDRTREGTKKKGPSRRLSRKKKEYLSRLKKL